MPRLSAAQQWLALAALLAATGVLLAMERGWPGWASAIRRLVEGWTLEALVLVFTVGLVIGRLFLPTE